MLHESAGTAHVEAVTSDEETAPAVFDGAEGLAYWVDMLMVSHDVITDPITCACLHAKPS